MYTLSDTRLEWLGEGLLFELDLNKCWAQMWALFESPLDHYLYRQAWGPWPAKAPV